MTPEAKVKHQVYKILRKNGAYYFSPIMNGYGKSGVPDIIVCYNGKFVGIDTLVINENNILAVQDLLNRM